MPALSCDIADCKSSINKVTSEEAGDSGRSSDRIPDELRKQWKAPTTNTGILPGKSKCTECNRPARPSISQQTVHILCERCSFACLRCGATNPIAPETTTLVCDFCAGVWDMGALGFECVQQPAAKPSLDVPLLKRFGKESYAEFLEDAHDTAFGDEMNALSDYYFSLAIDRPESPPL
jgi:DNA-directed RNA polymerase subunit RPC12/RpoP